MALLRHSLALLAALALLPAALAWGLVRPRDLRGLSQRLGRLPRVEPGGVWVHGASVGEAVLVARVARALRERGERVHVSATSATGLQRLGALLPDVPRALAPLDHPWSTARALARIRPRALVLIETELWPVWLAEAARAGIPVVILSGRLSARPARILRRVRGLWRPGLRAVAGIAARSEVDAARFVALGVDARRVRVGGDLKQDEAPPPAPGWARALADRPLWVAASTHEGEEAVVLEAWRLCRASGCDARLVLAPRHPERCEAVASLCRREGFAVARRSACARRADEGAPAGGAPERRGSATAPSGCREPAREAALADGAVLLLDTLGELSSLYRLAHVVFVGGSLVPAGGHDPWLPLRGGCALLAGPHRAAWSPEARRLLEADPTLQVRDASELARGVAERLAEPRGARLAALRAALPRPGRILERQLAWLEEWAP